MQHARTSVFTATAHTLWQPLHDGYGVSVQVLARLVDCTEARLCGRVRRAPVDRAGSEQSWSSAAQQQDRTMTSHSVFPRCRAQHEKNNVIYRSDERTTHAICVGGQPAAQLQSCITSVRLLVPC